MRSSMLRPRKNAMFSSIYRFGKSSLVVFSTARCCSGKILWLWFTHCQFFSDCLLEYSTIKMSFGLLFWLWKRQCLQVSAFSFRFRKQCWCKYLYIKLSLKLPKASLTTFYGLGGAKTSAGIGEGLRIPNAIRCHSAWLCVINFLLVQLMHVPVASLCELEMIFIGTVPSSYFNTRREISYLCRAM